MLVARTKSGRRINAKYVSEKYNKGDFICPSCGNSVFPKKGKIKIDHFSHYPKEGKNCESWEPETERHLEMKDASKEYFSMFDWVKSTKLEYDFGKEKPRTDLLVVTETGFELAVECQHSKISDKEIKERTEKLEKEVDSVMWIYDKKIFRKKFRKKTDNWFFTNTNRLFFLNGEKERKLESKQGSYYILDDLKKQVLDLNEYENICFSYNTYKRRINEIEEIKGKINRIIHEKHPTSRSEIKKLIHEWYGAEYINPTPLLLELKTCSRCGTFIFPNDSCPRCRKIKCKICGEYKLRDVGRFKNGVCRKCRIEWAKQKRNEERKRRGHECPYCGKIFMSEEHHKNHVRGCFEDNKIKKREN